MSLIAIKAWCEPIRSLSYPNFSNSYVHLGTPLSHPARWLKFDNVTDGMLMISLDGVTDHIFLFPSGYLVWDISSNKSIGQASLLAEGTQIHVKQVSSVTMGSLYLSVSYNTEN